MKNPILMTTVKTQKVFVLSTSAVLFLSSNLTLAQEPKQSPENAQVFLQEILQRQSAEISYYVNGIRNFVPTTIRKYGPVTSRQREWEDSPGGGFAAPSRVVQKITSDSVCQTSVFVQPKFIDPYKDLNSNTTEIRGEYLRGPFGIDWSSVAEVEKTGSSVLIKGISMPLRFDLPSEATASRVAYAMEFLRINCDSTARTGF